MTAKENAYPCSQRQQSRSIYTCLRAKDCPILGVSFELRYAMFFRLAECGRPCGLVWNFDQNEYACALQSSLAIVHNESYQKKQKRSNSTQPYSTSPVCIETNFQPCSRANHITQLPPCTTSQHKRTSCEEMQTMSLFPLL